MAEPGKSIDSGAQQALETAVPDSVARNISDILELESRELAGTTLTQRWLEALSRRLARPAFPVGVVLFISVWIAVNLTPASVGILRFDPPPFPWLGGLLSLTALLTTTIVLIGQGRQSVLAEQRAHLDLQISLLTEQKVTKLIHLLEELRTDLPGVRMRHDPHVSELKKATDPAQLASLLKEARAPRRRQRHMSQHNVHHHPRSSSMKGSNVVAGTSVRPLMSADKTGDPGTGEASRESPRTPDDTPGRPTSSGSRQQNRPDQNSQSGDPELDEELTGSGAAAPTTEKPTRSATRFQPAQG